MESHLAGLSPVALARVHLGVGVSVRVHLRKVVAIIVFLLLRLSLLLRLTLENRVLLACLLLDNRLALGLQ